MPWLRARRSNRPPGIPYPGELAFEEGHRVFGPGPDYAGQDGLELLQDIAIDWFGDPPDETYYAIYVWHRPENLRIKGGPADPNGPDVRHGNPTTLQRWRNNAKMREVASAQYPRERDHGAAVERWWRKGGSMQPLRWSGSEVERFRNEISLELVGQVPGGGTAQPGEAILMVQGTPYKLASPAVRERDRARQRERYARKQARKGRSVKPRRR